MAIFQKNLRNTFLSNTISYMAYGYGPIGLSTSPQPYYEMSGSITFWGGAQPSAADIYTNWVASYKTSYLLHLQGLSIRVSSPAVPDVGILIANSTTPTATAAFNSGTITWAVIWTANLTPGDIATFGSVPASYPKYIVLPVSDTTGTYPVRLPTTTVATGGTTYTLGDVSIVAGGGIA